MNFINQTVYLDKEEDRINVSLLSKSINIILLREDIFIKIVEINKTDNIEKLLQSNINGMVQDYEVLIHYDKLFLKKKKYIIIYFTKYYNTLRNIINTCSSVNIIPYQLKCSIGKFHGKNNLVVTEFKGCIYLILRVRGKVMYSKTINRNEIHTSINSALSNLKNNNISDLNIKLFIDENLYDESLKKQFYNFKIIKKRGEFKFIIKNIKTSFHKNI